MDANPYSLEDILKPDRRYVIPTFQRDYEWTRDGQWNLLLDDLLATAERLLDTRRRDVSPSRRMREENNATPHFLGAIVCAHMPFATGGVPLRSVIDGQQRLTTLQLLIRGLLDVLQVAGHDRANTVRRMLFNPEDVVKSEEDHYKLWPRRHDRQFWPAVMSDDRPQAVPVEHPYFQARHYFSEAIRDHAMDDGGNLDHDVLTALVDAVGTFFRLVVIDLADNDDAQVIFEVLNGRQTPLSAMDLVKNLVFLRAELDEEDVQNLYDRYWAGFDDEWWKTTIGRGHAAREHREVLLSVWLTAVTGTEANVRHLYRDARGYINDSPSIETILKDLSRFARAYEAFYGRIPAKDEKLAESYGRIRALEITTAIPLITWLATLTSDQLRHQDHVEAVQAVESWAVRRVYVGSQTRGYGHFLARTLKEAKLALEHGGDVLGLIRTHLREGNLAWPSDDDVRWAFINRAFYGNINQYRLRLLLSAIDQRIRFDDPYEPDAIISYDKLQLEHIMPRAWQEHWSLYDEHGNIIKRDPEEPVWRTGEADRNAFVDRIGNLTLVTDSFNTAVSNHSWETKRREFQGQRSLMITNELAASERWDEGNIVARGQRLAEIMISIWPGPSVEQDSA